MAGEAGAGERTEAATPKRIKSAREQGNVPLSRDAASAAVLAAGALVLAIAAPGAADALARGLARFLSESHEWSLIPATKAAGRLGAAAALPALLAMLGAAAGAVLLQTGLLFRVAAVKPDFGRLNPAAGLKRIVGVENAIEAAKSVAKVAVAGAVVWRAIGGGMHDIGRAADWSAAALADAIARQILAVLVALLATQAAIAAIDVLIVRLRHAREMRMSREEIREEQRETDGDPKIKARIRQLRQQRARRRMMTAVAKAAVVVTNPTHYAVALAYERGRQAAPRVVAKGVDEMAARIRAAAEQHRVPQVANPPLARALHRVELDAEIPAEHYQVVAEIIAYVWRLNRPAGHGGGPVR